MTTASDHIPDNRLLAALGPDDRGRLAPHLERVDLEPGAVLFEPGGALTHAWFPEGCVVSLALTTREGRTAEAITVGREGAVGLAEALGSGRALGRGVVQVPGPALRLPLGRLRAALEASPGLRRLCSCQVQALVAGVMQVAVCNALHEAEARLGEWLLVLHDQAGAGGAAALPVKQEFLAGLLGVQRSTVSAAAVALQDKGLIRYRRGRVWVLDRAGLEAVSCGCYGLFRAAREVLWGDAPPEPAADVA